MLQNDEMLGENYNQPVRMIRITLEFSKAFVISVHIYTVAHKGRAAILKVTAILNNFLRTNKTCCMIKIPAAIAFNVLQIKKKCCSKYK